MSPSLGAPEGAIVAAFERMDVIGSDAMTEIVGGSVEPDRALSDAAFAHRLAERPGTAILIAAGPLVVAPDLSIRLPVGSSTRAGRALALQMLGVLLARGDGLPVDQVIVDALSPWLTEEPAAGARAIAEVAVRRAALRRPPARVRRGPSSVPSRSGVMAARPGRRRRPCWRRRPRAADRGLRAGRRGAWAKTARAAAGSPATWPRHPRPARFAASRSTTRAGWSATALVTLQRLADDGWRTVAGDPPPARVPRGREAVAERTESFDPIATLIARRG